MPYLEQGLTAVTLVTIVLIALMVLRPSEGGPTAGSPSSYRRWGQILAFVVLFVLPVLISGLGVSSHLEQSKSTEFCLSCHVMEPYGESLSFDEADFVPATHYQNRLIPHDQACYTCHTQYALFGDIKTKLGGLKHLYVYYLGQVPEKIKLYAPYQNRECLHCHGGARSFEKNELHLDVRAELENNEVSCLDCHDRIHQP